MEVYDERELLVWRERVGEEEAEEGVGGGVERWWLTLWEKG